MHHILTAGIGLLCDNKAKLVFLTLDLTLGKVTRLILRRLKNWLATLRNMNRLHEQVMKPQVYPRTACIAWIACGRSNLM